MRHRALRSRTGNPGNNGLDEKGASGARESAEPTAWQGPTRVQLRDELSLHCFELRDSQHQLSGIIDTSLPSDSTCAWPLRAIAPFDLIAAADVRPRRNIRRRRLWRKQPGKVPR